MTKLCLLEYQQELNVSIKIIKKYSEYGDYKASPFEFPRGHKIWGEPDSAWIKVSLTPEAFNTVKTHAESYMREVGGLLLGRIFIGEEGLYHTEIEAAIPDHFGESSISSYKFTFTSYMRMLDEKEASYPNLRIVGWYHSHPDFGAFFSETDKNSHSTYYNYPGRVGLVIDPIRKEGLFFAISPTGGEPESLPGFYEQFRSVVDWSNWLYQGLDDLGRTRPKYSKIKHLFITLRNRFDNRLSKAINLIKEQ